MLTLFFSTDDSPHCKYFPFRDNPLDLSITLPPSCNLKLTCFLSFPVLTEGPRLGTLIVSHSTDATWSAEFPSFCLFIHGFLLFHIFDTEEYC